MSMRVEGPGAGRMLNDSTNSADTMSIGPPYRARGTRPQPWTAVPPTHVAEHLRSASRATRSARFPTSIVPRSERPMSRAGVGRCRTQRILERDAAVPDDVCDRAVHRQRTAREGAVLEARCAVDHPERGAADLASPPRDRVRHEDDVAGSLRREGEADGGGMHVDEVRDQRHLEAAIGQRGPEQTGLPVVERAHPVEQVRDERRAGVGCRGRLRERGGRVAERRDDALGSEGPDRVDAREVLRGRAW